RMTLAFVGLGWAALALMCFFQFVRRQTTLDYNYMAFALYPQAFACLGAALSWRTRTARDAALAAGLAAAALLGTLLFLLPSPVPTVLNAVSASTGVAWAGASAPPLA